ncbi:MAG: bifunctional 2-C-methyl-D-erythritol 4-phosphate cytidylyltransferase/2-C-methyl-D-erythritol 2,4-cyclodiphosphate synthase [Rhodospirillales bacterium]|nr:bifunctional 2-C-methyl-D-erythritol 4-phosphate cytidylyltransferase/2-C-methyl-D-erythritol 2,4-cyclodiphosphate synthase [Rhodospirillales bacterium]
MAAAGSGSRFGNKTPKQYLHVAGKPLLRHSIDTFLSMPTCASLHVIIDPSDADLYHDAVQGLNLPGAIAGSNTRNKSIFNGLKTIPKLKSEDLILIHDAARPCINAEDIASLLMAMQAERAATLATQVSATLRRSKQDDLAAEQVSRDDLWIIQTPQAFLFGDLLEAHEKAPRSQDATDDTALVSALGIPVKLVEGAASNIKITHPQDLIMAEKLLNPPTITLTGQGFDVHAFAPDKPGPVRIGGIDISHDRALKGHSDADVALHALTDAILGSLGQGDIGRHFPPSDNRFKNMNSAIFLKKALDLLKDQNATLNNIDLTIICEAPKIGPHEPRMRQRLAELTGLPPARINIKATTTEGLGFTGRREGIAAQAIVSVSVQDAA